ncbi:SLAP domain-containing protein [Lactobacillus sp. R2/2]|nr:SLAP domain-containing protein [Lactobacillus sp. R2/2]
MLIRLIILAGSTVNTVNFQMINNKGYYLLDDGLFIAAANIDAKKLKLKHNAYVYSQHGIRISKKFCINIKLSKHTAAQSESTIRNIILLLKTNMLSKLTLNS